MVIFTQENGVAGKNMEKEIYNMQMGLFIRGRGKTIWQVAKEF